MGPLTALLAALAVPALAQSSVFDADAPTRPCAYYHLENKLALPGDWNTMSLPSRLRYCLKYSSAIARRHRELEARVRRLSAPWKSGELEENLSWLTPEETRPVLVYLGMTPWGRLNRMRPYLHTLFDTAKPFTPTEAGLVLGYFDADLARTQRERLRREGRLLARDPSEAAEENALALERTYAPVADLQAGFSGGADGVFDNAGSFGGGFEDFVEADATRTHRPPPAGTAPARTLRPGEVGAPGPDAYEVSIEPESPYVARWADKPLALSRHEDESVAYTDFLEWADGKSYEELLGVRKGSSPGFNVPGPSERVRYVRDPADPSRVIDMRHFFMVGRYPEWVGWLGEAQQWWSGVTNSAFDPQDFYANALGREYHNGYHDATGTEMEKLKTFFEDRARRRRTAR